MEANELAKYIDHTLLKSDATKEDIIRLCNEAKEYGFACVSINQRWVPLASELLYGSDVNVGGVVSLPLGGDLTSVKVFAAREAIMAGADEIDVVIDVAAVIAGDEKFLTDQLKALEKVCHLMRPGVALKVIIEAAALNEGQKIMICKLCSQVGVDFVKTSTGMHEAGGASIADVKLMKEHAPNCKVKAAGGIRTVEQVKEFVEAGAERIGTSAGVGIMNELKAES